MKIDNFALTMFQTCPEKYHLRMIQGWTPQRRSGALGFGGAIHEGLAEWYRSHSIGQAMLAIEEAWPPAMPVDDYRTKEKCLQVMVEYSKHYPAETFSVVQGPSGPLIEVPFTLDTGRYLPCALSWLKQRDSTGMYLEDPNSCGMAFEMPDADGRCPNCLSLCEPIEYGGIFDGLVEYSGAVYVLEHKSTSMLGSTYFNQFNPNNQVTGYVWAAGQMSGRKVGGAMINALGVYKVGKTKFERHMTARFPEQIAEWMNNVHDVCLQLKTAERKHIFTRSTNACTLYGMCEYHSVCSLGRQAERNKRLEMDYQIDHWDYEKRGGTEVASTNG